MNDNVVTYVLYLLITVPLTIWVARALYTHGAVFLHDVFDGDDRLAGAVDRLLVIGFYLLNLGYVCLFMTDRASIRGSRQVLEELSMKVGGVALVVGVVHFGNVWAFNTFRRRAEARRAAPPPPPPGGAQAPVGWGGWPPPPGPALAPAPTGGWPPPQGPAPAFVAPGPTGGWPTGGGSPPPA